MARWIVVATDVLVVVAQIAVVLQEMRNDLGNMHPLMHVRGTVAIKGKGEKKEQAAHWVDEGMNRLYVRFGRRVAWKAHQITAHAPARRVTLRVPLDGTFVTLRMAHIRSTGEQAYLAAPGRVCLDGLENGSRCHAASNVNCSIIRS